MMGRRIAAVFIALLATLLTGAVAAPAAHAHTDLVRSVPADGARLANVPREMRFVFSEPIEAASTEVRAGSDDVPVSQVPGKPAELSAELSRIRAGKNGLLTISWRTVDEADAHAAGGRITLHIGSATAESTAPQQEKPDRAAAPAPAADAPDAPDSAVKNALVAAHWSEYLALALFLGGLAFLGALWPQGAEDRRTRIVLTLSWTVGLLATLATTGLQGAYAGMGSLHDAISPHAFAEVLATEPGVVPAARMLLWLLAAVVLVTVLQGGERAARSPGWRIGAGAVGLGLLRTVGMAGHGSHGSHPGWGGLADLIHLTGVSVWLGGLTLLLVGVLPRRRPEELAAVVPRYSTLAFASVIAIAAAGVVLTWQVVGSFDGLLHTSYGRLLLIKIAVLASVLLVAQRSKAWVRNRLDIAVLLRGDAVTVRPFMYSIAAEAALILAVLAATSLLVTAAPGR